jgi:hypothetical protein
MVLGSLLLVFLVFFGLDVDDIAFIAASHHVAIILNSAGNFANLLKNFASSIFASIRIERALWLICFSSSSRRDISSTKYSDIRPLHARDALRIDTFVVSASHTSEDM